MVEESHGPEVTVIAMGEVSQIAAGFTHTLDEQMAQPR